MTLMNCSVVTSSGIVLQLVTKGRIRRRRVCACKVFVVGSQRRMKHFLVFAKNPMRRPRRQRPWWKSWFSDWNDEDESLSSWREDDELLEEVGSEDGMSEDEKFETWKRKAEAIVELREAQQDDMNAEGRSWEDWISGGSMSGDGDWGGDVSMSEQITDDPAEIVRAKNFIDTFRDSIDEDYSETLFEDRVFVYASTNSAKFIAFLIVVPWLLDFLVHDYVLMPFLDRYVQRVPLAAEMLDVRRSQKLQMIKDLNIEKARYRFDAEIGKSPTLSDDELWSELREKVIKLRDEWRLENRKAFANILSDMVFGITLFLLMYFNQSKVAMLKFTGYKFLNNISDAGKAFLIIVVADIILGYHSEVGWYSLVEAILEHYGIEADQAAITFFVCLVPVAIDSLAKFWIYKYLPGLSPTVRNIFDEIKRH